MRSSGSCGCSSAINAHFIGGRWGVMRHSSSTNPSPLKASHLTRTSAIPLPESPPRLLWCTVLMLTCLMRLRGGDSPLRQSAAPWLRFFHQQPLDADNGRNDPLHHRMPCYDLRRFFRLSGNSRVHALFHSSRGSGYGKED